MWTDHTLLSVARLASALLGMLLFATATKAYVSKRRRSLLALAAGAGTLTAGYLLAGGLVELFGWSVQEATMIESIFTLLAITLLVASLYLRDAAHATKKRHPAEADKKEVSHG